MTITAVPHINLQALAGPDLFNQAVHLEETQAAVRTLVRGVEMHFVASSRRLLWQSLGQEYIEPELLDFIDAIPAGCSLFDIGASTGFLHCMQPSRAVPSSLLSLRLPTSRY
jgi:hypothetical protein